MSNLADARMAVSLANLDTLMEHNETCDKINTLIEKNEIGEELRLLCIEADRTARELGILEKMEEIGARE